MKIGITGAGGFIGRNLVQRLSELEDIEILQYTRTDNEVKLKELVLTSDWIFHLAGINRPKTEDEFTTGNIDLTKKLTHLLIEQGKSTPVVLSSSIQAVQDNPYGQSKLGAEEALIDYSKKSGGNIHIYRLPNVFGKWSRPNYNSAVSTFCNNILNELPISINNPDANINLVYIDDVIDSFIALIQGEVDKEHYRKVSPVYDITVGKLAEQLQAFKNSRENLIVEHVGAGLTRALYSTYISYMRPEQFSYVVPEYADERGKFAEIIKTKESGQFSFFTAKPGITRGGHYHHSKNEKFIVLSGQALFGFRHVQTNEYYEKKTSGEITEIVETIPGWSHDIKNIGETELVVMLWANEIFDRDAPDTIAAKVK